MTDYFRRSAHVTDYRCLAVAVDFRKVYSVVHYRRQNSVFAVVAVYCLYVYHSVYYDFVVVAVDY